jgi:hypothetical protein
LSERRTSIYDEAFDYRTRKDGTVVISHHGHPVTTLRGKEAAKFAGRIEGLGERGAQLLMARVTGNFKRGNGRR